MQLNKIAPYKNENLGPGVYAKALDVAPGAQPKNYGSNLAKAFGSSDDRKLDTTAI